MVIRFVIALVGAPLVAALPHIIPSNTVTINSATWGRQKQSCPGQAASVLYWPIIIRPPRVTTMVQSAWKKTHRRPNQRPNPRAVTDRTVIRLLCQVLNRLA